MRIHSRIAAGVIMALMFVIGIGAGSAAGAPAEPTLPSDRSGCTDFGIAITCPSNQLRAGQQRDDWWDESGNWMGYTVVTTKSDSRNKLLQACDEHGDGISPAIWIDPLGAGPPDTLVYRDENGSQPGCLNHTIAYDVRKWSPTLESGGVSILLPDWQLAPFPPCPPCTPV